MSDIKLFQLKADYVTELTGSAVKIEKSLQEQIEKNLDTYLGVRFLATEYSTGVNHGGRIDTMGIDENGSPVIIENKRSINEIVINQGHFGTGDLEITIRNEEDLTKAEPLILRSYEGC